ncbi:hypothetical protein SteCoe_24602 [Stentor coeruleus]|uniref:Uncharacterized protein n=1 Tax=Stentor coeruleus TaxID=5963 RepID=A0A1R2BH86_9CILI|nr:hypothetical protein SteCoe_24602 [Stentor coeruleus]
MSDQNSPRPHVRISKKLPELLSMRKNEEAKLLLESALTDNSLPINVKISALNTLACVNSRMNLNKQALELLKQAVLYKDNMNDLHTSATLINLAAVLSLLSDHKNAYKFLLKSLSLLKTQNKQEELLCILYYNISAELIYLKKPQDSLAYYQLGWNIVREKFLNTNLSFMYSCSIAQPQLKRSSEVTSSNVKINKEKIKVKHTRCKTLSRSKDVTTLISPLLSPRIDSKPKLNNTKTETKLKKNNISISNRIIKKHKNNAISSYKSANTKDLNIHRIENRINKITTHIDSLQKQLINFNEKVEPIKGECLTSGLPSTREKT